MPAPLKQLPINSSLFPQKHVETAGPSSKTQHADKQRTEGVENVKHEALNGSEGKIILVDFDGDDDPLDPLNWSNKKKWLMTHLLCAMTLFIGLATSAYSVGISEMCKEFGVADVVGEVGMFTFNAAFAFLPPFFAPLSETIGRNPVYLLNYAGFTLFFLPLALGRNIWTIIIARFFSGCFGAAGTTLVGGGLADIWITSERSLPMAEFSFVAVLGTIFAPVYCGFILQGKGWRWIEWVQLIVNGAMCILEFALLKETRGSVILAKRAKQMRKELNDERYRAPSELERESYKEVLKDSCTSAFKLLYKEPVVLFFSIWISFAWGVMFLFFTLIPLTFGGNHGWGTGTSGLGYIGLVVGTIIGFGSNLYQDHLYDQATANNGGVARPEARLYFAIIGGISFPIGLWWFSWTQFKSVHWIVPEIALVFVIFGIYHIFLATQNYITDSYGDNASSAISAQGFMRNAFAASFPLFGSFMFKGMAKNQELSYAYAGTLLSGLATLAVPFPFILYKWGPEIRRRSKFASAQLAKSADKEGRKTGRKPMPEASESETGSGEATAVHSRTTSPTQAAKSQV